MSDHSTVNELPRYFRVNPKRIYRRSWAKRSSAYKLEDPIPQKDIVWLK